jgi:hypothetical protein
MILPFRNNYEVKPIRFRSLFLCYAIPVTGLLIMDFLEILTIRITRNVVAIFSVL